jgi:Family of unknown function (DUF5906)
VNFLVYRLRWDAEEQKFRKKPTALDGSPLAEKQPVPLASREVCEAAVAREPAYRSHAWHDGLAVGLMLTEADSLFFLDLDKAVTTENMLTPEATAMVAPLLAVGAFFEPSSSGRGAHVIGRYSGVLPPHSNRRPQVHSHEFYVRDRGVVLHPEHHTGSWDVDCTPQVLTLIRDWFPPRNEGVELMPLTTGPRPEWRGPADDDTLLQRALTATGSAAARLGGKLTFAQLWAGQCEKNNESDMALAAHLAFWTGCDGDRMERLMRRSGLARDKWHEHRTYLRELTINQACVTTPTVYKEPARVDTAALLLGSPGVMPTAPASLGAPAAAEVVAGVDWHEVCEKAVQDVNNAGTYRELTDVVMPGLGSLGLPRVHAERVVTTLSKKLDLFGAKLPLATLRALVSPPVDHSQAGSPSQAPPWMAPICYVTAKDVFYNYLTGNTYSHEAFRMEYARLMPVKPTTGAREDPVVWARDKWNIAVVSGIEYRPDQESTFWHAGALFVNSFRPSTLPEVTAPSAECQACIDLFRSHLWQLVNHREPLYVALLCWLAHNVQYPGKKIRWSPLIKGVPGDGKSILGDLMFAAMGESNVKITSASTLANSGGFTDWATGRALNFIEEIRLEGKEKRRLYNAMKIFIGDHRIELNRKGKASENTLVNVTNHCAFTNYGDAVPVENGERRWAVVFTPWETAAQAAAIKGLPPSADSLVSYFKRLGTSMRAEPGAWRGWLMSIDVSSFDPDGRAPWSDERDAMMSGSGDFEEQTVQDCIARGGPGVAVEAFCSQCLMGQAHIAMGEKPDNRKWNRLLTDIGYRQFSTPIWWNGKTRRIWTKNSLTKEMIVEILNRTVL